jgi:hypothetical protein
MRSEMRLLLALASVIAMLSIGAFSASAQSGSDLAGQYAPVLVFSSGEDFLPVDVSFFIDNSVLRQRQGMDSSVVTESPTVALLSQHPAGDYYLDFSQDTRAGVLSAYDSVKAAGGHPVYVHVKTDGGDTVIQYWIFYAYNDGALNEHEGDWEMAEVVLRAGQPVQASYTQHTAGQTALWADVEKLDGTHPIVYAARGTHANYFRSYQGKFGLANDYVDGAGTRLQPAELSLVMLSEPSAATGALAWQNFGGRWGNYAKAGDAERGLAGPSTPGFSENKAKWDSPSAWSSGLEQLSPSILTMNYFVSIIPLLIIILLLAMVAWKGYRLMRTVKGKELIIHKLLKGKAAAGIVLVLLGLCVTLLAMVSPWFTLRGTIDTSVIETGGEVTLFSIDGISGVQINTLQDGRGISPLFSLMIPFGIIFLFSVVSTAFSLAGEKNPRKLGNGFIRSGVITGILPFVIIIIIVALMSQIAGVAGSLMQNSSGAQTVQTLLSEIAKSPLQGQSAARFTTYGNATFSWGIALGTYLFLIAGVLKIIGGFIIRTHKE